MQLQKDKTSCRSSLAFPAPCFSTQRQRWSRSCFEEVLFVADFQVSLMLSQVYFNPLYSSDRIMCPEQRKCSSRPEFAQRTHERHLLDRPSEARLVDGLQAQGLRVEVGSKGVNQMFSTEAARSVYVVIGDADQIKSVIAFAKGRCCQKMNG